MSPARIALLLLPAGLLAGLLILAASLPPTPDPPPPPPRETPPPQPTAEQLDAAVKAYQAVGGRYGKDVSYFRGRHVLHAFTLWKPAPDVIDRLPDPEFGYQLTVALRPDTPPGTLARLGRLKNLRRMHVGVDARADRTRPIDFPARIAELAAVPNLEDLSIYYAGGEGAVPLTDEIAARLLELKSLRSFVGEGPITDAGLETLSRHPTLERLSLQACPNITDAGLGHLAGMKTLRVLVLQDCPQPTAAGLRHFTREPRLTALGIGGRDMKGEALAEVGKIRTLELLNLTTFRGEVTVEGLGHIARLPRLRWMELRSVLVTDAGLEALSHAPKLEELAVVCREATDAGLRPVTRMTNLRTVGLFQAWRITDAGPAELAKLPRLETVYLLDVPGVGDAGLRSLARCASLTELVIDAKRGTGITPAGVREFVAGRGDRLRVLGVAGLGVDDDFVAFVAQAAPGLTDFRLDDNKGVTEKSLPLLEGMPRLRRVALNGTSIPHRRVVEFYQRRADRR